MCLGRLGNILLKKCYLIARIDHLVHAKAAAELLQEILSQSYAVLSLEVTAGVQLVLSGEGEPLVSGRHFYYQCLHLRRR